MIINKVLIWEFLTVDRCATGSIVKFDITSLCSEERDYSVEGAVLVGKGGSIWGLPFFSGTETFEVFSCFWDVRKKDEYNLPLDLAIEVDFKERVLQIL